MDAVLSQASSITEKLEDSKLPTHVLDDLISDKIAKQANIITRLSILALEKNDKELLKRLNKKRQELVEEMMSKVDDMSGNVNDKQYLELCNFMKVIY